MDFEITILNVLIYTFFLLVVFYSLFCVLARNIIRPDVRKLLYYVSLFSLFGVVGEHFTNTAYEYVFGSPLWEYYLYPSHGGNITYFFLSVWGVLGFYTYFRDVALRSVTSSALYSGLILGAEAIAIELFVNGIYYLLFGNFIFYYLPANLGPLSHFSCLQVIPFYMIVGYVTGSLIKQQELWGYRGLRVTLGLFWMVIITFVFL